MNNRFVQAVFAWLVPGAGHLLRKEFFKAALFFAIVNLALFAGLAIAGFRDIRMIDNPFFFVGRFGCGWVMMMLTMLTGYAPSPAALPELFEIGSLYACVAGLMNIIAVLSVLSPVKTPSVETAEAPVVQVQPPEAVAPPPQDGQIGGQGA